MTYHKENRPVDGRLHRGEDGEDQKGLAPGLGYQGDREEIRSKRAVLTKELVTLSVGKWRPDELRGVQADLAIADGEPEFKGVIARTQPPLSAVCSTPRGISTGHFTETG